MSKLSDKIKLLPSNPGVYLMKDSAGKIIYVGKAKNLKKRVSSYFTKSDLAPMTQALVNQIADFELMIANSEVEALLLERTLIKHHAPHYNILLRDDKEFPFIRINYKDEWPRIEKVRRRKTDEATYVGPFGNAGHLNTMLKTIRQIFPIVRCSQHEFKNATRPCNYYHMSLCLGPCVLAVDRNHYIDILKDAENLLRGKNQLVRKALKEKMDQASQSEQFERAAEFRDQLRALDGLKNHQVAVVQEVEEADVIGYFATDHFIAYHVLFVREFMVLGGDTFIVEDQLSEGASDQGFATFLMQYYEHRYLPDQLIVPLSLPDKADVLAALDPEKEGRTKIVQDTSAERHQLLKLAQKNAEFSLMESQKLTPHKQIELARLKEVLGLEKLPLTMECIDISNLQDLAIVASLVCFVDGKPAKDQYRKFEVKSVDGKPDDFNSIKEVVSRRLRRALENDEDLPDLLIIDGGKGQLGKALEALEEYPDLDLKVVSLAKARTKYEGDHAMTRTFERVFKPDSDAPILLQEASPEYRIMTQIRDEAHRFAVKYHRAKRTKISHHSALDDIQGLGKTLKRRLLTHFQDVNQIKAASIDDLLSVQGIHRRLAEAIKASLDQESLKPVNPAHQATERSVVGKPRNGVLREDKQNKS